MSEYMICKTEMRCRDSLVAAIVDCGIAREAIEVHEEPALLEGIESRRGQKASVIIRRNVVGSLRNDIGFRIDASGNYILVMSDMDRRNEVGEKILPKTMGGTGELVKQYGKNRALAEVKKCYGHTIKKVETLPDGRIRIRLVVS